MLTPEEAKVLGYLRRHACAGATDVAYACGNGHPAGWLGPVIARLDWLGYVTVFHDRAGVPSVLQITERGLAQVGTHRPAVV
jgi:hypothetical protein